MAMKRECKATTALGAPCRAKPLLESDFCLMHDPRHAESVQEGRRLGGQNRRNEATLAALYDIESVATVADLQRVIEIALSDLLRQPPSPSRTRGLLYLAQVGSALIDKGELEARVEAIETALRSRLPADSPKRRGTI